MRRMLRICLSLCAGMALGLVPLAGKWLFLLAGSLLLAGVIALIPANTRAMALILLPTALGMGWSAGYQQLAAAPVKSLAGTTQTVSSHALDYGTKSASGQWVPLRCGFENQSCTVDVYLQGYGGQISPGDAVTVELSLQDSAAGGDYYGYTQGVYLTGYGRGEPEIVPADFSLRYLPRYIAHALSKSVTRCFPEDVQGYAAALIVGDRSGLSLAEKTTLQQSGIYHTLALSGMHMTVLVSMLSFLRKSRHRAILGIPLCIGFTLVTGCSPSVVRACVMECCVLLDRALSRESDWATSLSLSGVLLMAENPWCILNWGLQLSFLSVLGIHLLAYPLCKRLMQQRKPHLRYRVMGSVLQNLSISLSAVVFTLPLMGLYFGSISLVSPVTNLLTAPIVSLCFAMSLPAGLIGIFLPGVGGVMGWVIGWGYRYVMTVSTLMAHVPFATLYTATGYGLAGAILVYLMLLVLVLTKAGQLRRISLCCGVMGLCVCFLLVRMDAATPSFTALDVGQGQSLLLETGGGSVLIDCGGSKSSPGDLAADHLSARGISRIRLLILTHYDEDHAGGVPELLERMPVDVILMPDILDENRAAIEAAAKKTGTNLYPVSEDLEATLGSTRLTVYGPASPSSGGNEAGLSIYAALPDFSVLVTGDLSSDSEAKLLRNQSVPHADLLVAGHHGSKYSTSALLLRKIAPKAVVISVGENSYGHPAGETLSRIQAAGATILRTDQMGTIRCIGAEDGIRVECTGTD